MLTRKPVRASPELMKPIPQVASIGLLAGIFPHSAEGQLRLQPDMLERLNHKLHILAGLGDSSQPEAYELPLPS